MVVVKQAFIYYCMASHLNYNLDFIKKKKYSITEHLAGIFPAKVEYGITAVWVLLIL